MDKKLIGTITFILISLFCLGIVSAENNTALNNDTDKTDLTGYITAISIGKEVEFSDGFTGFQMNSSKNTVSQNDGFTAEATSDNSIMNMMKSAINEAYKAHEEDNIAQIVKSIADGSYENSNDPVIQAALASNEKISDCKTVEINSTTQATFNFEILKAADENTSEYFAYNVSLKQITPPAPEASHDSENLTSKDDLKHNSSFLNNQKNNSADKKEENVNNTTNIVQNITVVNQTNTTIVNQKNTTIINENNTTIINHNNKKEINENNTTIINHNNKKEINDSLKADEKPVKENVMEAAGNPIVLLIAALVLGGAIAIVLHRKD